MTRRLWLYMAGAAALWGASYMFIKVALEDTSEGFIIFARTMLGALVLVPLGLRAGALRPILQRKRATLLLASLQVAIPFGLITWGERWVDSGLAGILVASAPIWVALIALRADAEERSHGWALVGTLTGMVGVGLLFGVDLSGDANELLGGGMIVIAALAYALAGFVVKRNFVGVPPVGVAASTMVVSAAVYAPLAIVTFPERMPDSETVGSLLVLGAGGTGVAFLLYYTLMAELGPARASVIAYIAPAFAVVYGVTLLDETLTISTIAGLLLILGGSWLAAQGRLPAWLSRIGPSRSSVPAPVRAR